MNLHELAERFGTPAYVYELADVRAAHRDLRAALPPASTLYYSLKANPHPRLVGALAELGCRAEVCSQGEVTAALAAGVQPTGLLLTGPGKTAETIEHAVVRGVRRFSVDSPTDLARVGRVAARHGVHAECLLRVNADEPVPGMGLAMTGTASQFGADSSWVLREPELFRRSYAARVTGLHLYMGTNVQDEQTLLRQFEVAATIAARLRTVLGDLDEVDLGGGFGAPYARAGHRPRFDHLADRLADLLDTRLPGWRAGQPRIAFESGRYLVADAGVLLCRVVDVKVSKGQTFTVLDAGINHLGGMAGLRRLPPIVPTLQQVPGDDSVARDGTVPTAVVGPLCTPLDTFTRSTDLPAPRPGDLVAVPNVGAYGMTASLLAFLSHPTPVEVVTDGGVPAAVSRLHLTHAELPYHDPVPVSP
jgi:diaminopimelate decarboxylase